MSREGEFQSSRESKPEHDDLTEQINRFGYTLTLVGYALLISVQVGPLAYLVGFLLVLLIPVAILADLIRLASWVSRRVRGAPRPQGEQGTIAGTGLPLGKLENPLHRVGRAVLLFIRSIDIPKSRSPIDGATNLGIPRVCSSCGALVPEGAASCPACGAAASGIGDSHPRGEA